MCPGDVVLVKSSAGKERQQTNMDSPKKNMCFIQAAKTCPRKHSFLTDGKVQAFVSRFGWVRALTSECDLQCKKVVFGAGGGLKDHERK